MERGNFTVIFGYAELKAVADAENQHGLLSMIMIPVIKLPMFRMKAEEVGKNYEFLVLVNVSWGTFEEMAVHHCQRTAAVVVHASLLSLVDFRMKEGSQEING